jgi:monofunctional glycosyltransferase
MHELANKGMDPAGVQLSRAVTAVAKESLFCVATGHSGADTTVVRLGRLALRVGLVLLFAPTAVIILYRYLDPPVTPLMLLRLAQGEALDYRPVPLSRVSPNLIAAVIAAEDNLFCRHYGFDARAMREELDTWLDGDRPRGASTITMQTAKNVLLWPGRDLVRKLTEAWLTPQIEWLWSKRRILEVYLGVAELGPGVYGAEAASRLYFGKPAAALGRREAALLAAVLPNPLERSAGRPSPYVARRASRIMRRAEQIEPLIDCLWENR